MTSMLEHIHNNLQEQVRLLGIKYEQLKQLLKEAQKNTQ